MEIREGSGSSECHPAGGAHCGPQRADAGCIMRGLNLVHGKIRAVASRRRTHQRCLMTEHKLIEVHG